MNYAFLPFPSPSRFLRPSVTAFLFFLALTSPKLITLCTTLLKWASQEQAVAWFLCLSCLTSGTTLGIQYLLSKLNEHLVYLAKVWSSVCLVKCMQRKFPEEQTVKAHTPSSVKKNLLMGRELAGKRAKIWRRGDSPQSQGLPLPSGTLLTMETGHLHWGPTLRHVHFIWVMILVPKKDGLFRQITAS